MAQVVDKGRIVAAVDKYQEKVNGQVQLDNNGNPKMKNKWMAIGEATKWRNDDGTTYVSEKIYLKPVSVQGAYFEQRTFWDSENQQALPQQGGFNQSPQQNSYNPNNANSYQSGMNNNS